MSALGEVLAAVDDELAAYTVSDPGAGRFGHLVDDPDRAFVLEAVYEGYLMHHGEPRAFAGMDPDLRLLAGDALYALGLSRLARAGDLDAVAELADLITLAARAEAEGRSELPDQLWQASAELLAGESDRGARAAVSDRLDAPPGTPPA